MDEFNEFFFFQLRLVVECLLTPLKAYKKFSSLPPELRGYLRDLSKKLCIGVKGLNNLFITTAKLFSRGLMIQKDY